MNKELREKIDYIKKLKDNPHADYNTIRSLQKGLEYVDLSPLTIQERKELSEVCSL